METEDRIDLGGSGESVDGKEHDDSFGNGRIEVSSLEIETEIDVQHKVPRDTNLNGGDSDMEIEDLNVVSTRDNGSYDLNEKPGQADCESGIAADQLIEMKSESLVVIKDNAPAISDVERNPSVCVKYNFLTRSSKNKLEELLQQWSEWHAQHSSTAQSPDDALESGEETLFPALHIGLENSSSVSFWMDQQPQKQKNNEYVALDYKSVPMYDRGYALGLTSDDGTSNVERGLEIIEDAARCFNCGSYSHALRDCPKPRDVAAVNSARKQLQSKRNQNSASRNQTRYYQDSPAGKFDGLRPGALHAETRKLLGLGELDPPPWLNRMREIGYPPGYLDPEEDHLSGITIFGDHNEIKDEQEDGEIVGALPVETEKPEPKKKMSVEFPGINGPIPKNADEKLWADRPHRHSSATHSTGHVIRTHHREDRWSRSEFMDDGPPGVDRGFNPAISTHIPGYSQRFHPYGRPEPDRGRRFHVLDEGLHGPRHSPTDYGASRHWNAHDDRYRHLSRR